MQSMKVDYSSYFVITYRYTQATWKKKEKLKIKIKRNKYKLSIQRKMTE